MKKCILASILAIGLFMQTSITSFAETVEISIVEKPNINILLTSGTYETELFNFKEDLCEKLEDSGIDTSNITFQTIEQKTAETDSTDLNFADVVNSWKGYGALCWNADGNIIYMNDRGGQTNHNYYSGQRWLQSHSKETTPNAAEYWGAALLNPDAFEYDNIEVKFNVVSAGNLHNGFCFNVTENSDGTLNGYFFSLSHHIKQVGNYTTPTSDATLDAAAFYPNIRNQSYSLYLYRFDHWQPDIGGWNEVGKLSCCWFNHAEYYPANGNFTRKLPICGGTATILKGWELPYKDRKNVKYTVNVADGHIVITQNGATVVDIYDNTFEKGSYGFWGNQCEQNASMRISDFNVKNVQIVKKSYIELLNAPSWDEDALHIIINADIEKNDTLNTAETLAKTLADDIYYIHWGNSENEEEATAFIKGNDNKGLFLKDTDYNILINKTANYIKGLLYKGADTQYAIIGRDTELSVTPEKFKTNAENVEFPNGRWIIHHNYTYFDNNLGQSNQTENYTKNLELNFDKPGAYNIYFDDALIKTIYVHRLPVADFDIKYEDKKLDLTSKSYDEDSNKDIGFEKGIAKETWYYKTSNDANWTVGKLENVNNADVYIIKLEVEDFQGTTNYITKYVGTGNPVAKFSFANSKVSAYKALDINNFSYDPNGFEITNYNWTLIKNKKKITTFEGQNPEIDFNDYGAGNYTLTLDVTNSKNMTSSVYTKTFTVEEDTTPPSVTIDPTYCDWKESQNINVSVYDSDSGLLKWRYCYTQNQNNPEESQWGEWKTNADETLFFDTDGEYYLHFEGYDNAGNKLERTVGSYKITHPYVNKISHHFGVANTSQFETYDWGKWYNPTNEFKLNVKGFEIKENNLASYPALGTAISSDERIKQPSSSVNFDFYYQPIKYDINYEYVLEDVKEVDNPTTYTILDSIELENPEMEGYEFIGWYLDNKLVTGINRNISNDFANFDEFIDELDKRTAEDVTLTAKWNQIQFTEGTNVFATIASEYTVTIPKTVVLSGQSKAAKYFVKVQGDIGGQEEVSVVPDESFNLNTKGKDSQNATVMQDKTSWKYDNFDTDANGTIKAPDITAGKWLGTFNFNIDFNGNTDEASSEESIEYQTIEYPRNNE